MRPIAHYTMGAGLEAMRRETERSSYHSNHRRPRARPLRPTLALPGADEAVTDTYRHDAWGVLLAQTGSTVNPHTYVGRERYYRMPNAEMYHLGFRDYAQGLGRFMTVDPLFSKRSGGLQYVLGINRPSVSVDPTGMDLRIIVIGIIVIVIVVIVVDPIAHPPKPASLTIHDSCDECMGSGKTYRDELRDQIASATWLQPILGKLNEGDPHSFDPTCVRQAFEWNKEHLPEDRGLAITCWTPECRDESVGGKKISSRHFAICPQAFTDPRFDSPVCVALHEAVHACSEVSIGHSPMEEFVETAPEVRQHCPNTF